MALPRFFDRVFAAAGRHLTVGRESLESALANRVVTVHCGADVATSQNARWIAELVVNLFARLYPRLGVFAPLPERGRLLSLAREINPAITIEEVSAATDHAVVIGNAESVPSAAIHVAAEGWVLHVQRSPIRVPAAPANPFSSAAAAAIATAEVFRSVFAERLTISSEMNDLHLSLLDFGKQLGADRPLGASDLGEVAIVGLGAVGNAALWCLGKHEGLAGTAFLVDPENIELSNLQRYILTNDSHVGWPKVDLAKAALAGTRVVCESYKQTLEQFADSSKSRLPCICVSVDNVIGRRCAQALLPKLVINGWTSDSGLGASWHLFSRDAACLSCLYMPTGMGKSQTELVAEAFGLPHDRATMLWVARFPPNDAELRQMGEHLGVSESILETWRGRTLPELYSEVVCGSVRLDVKGLGRVEAVPLAHQSVLAGVLMAAELVKRNDPELAAISPSETLTVWDDVLRPPPARWTQPRARVPRCICGDATYQDVYREKWRY